MIWADVGKNKDFVMKWLQMEKEVLTKITKEIKF
jgi:hypothetical protein